MALPPPPSVQEESEDWLVTYADAITLLMAFFVMLVSFSKVDMEVYDQVSSGLRRDIAREDQQTKSQVLSAVLKEVVTEAEADQVVNVGSDSNGITLELDSNAFFRPGSAELLPIAIPFLKNVTKELSATLYSKFNISVEGHTDDDPIASAKFPSNWELSSARASTVVRFMIDESIKSNRLKATGYAETQPKLPNRDPNGQAIIENQRENRRVVVRISRRLIFEPIKIPKFRRKDKKSATKSISQEIR